MVSAVASQPEGGGFDSGPGILTTQLVTFFHGEK